MEAIEKIIICKYDNGKIREIEDQVVKESPFTIFLNKEELLTLLCTPRSLEYLTFGFLLSEGFIKSRNDIVSIKLLEEEGVVEIETKNKSIIAKKMLGKRTMTTGCGKGTTFYNVVDSFNSKQIHSTMRVQSEDLIEIINKFNKSSDLFLSTGGVHSASLSDGKELLLFHEDVGRHNAIDKIIGEAFIKDIYLLDKLIITSGRISSEMLIKAAKREIPMIVSRSAPTDLAINLGKQLGITIVGFARGKRMNIYSHDQRIVF